ncbi:MAG TPA: TIM barrel protein [Opitutaceae bacterium]|nr:TIM barrel protein [Opitutaceae bacterium]
MTRSLASLVLAAVLSATCLSGVAHAAESASPAKMTQTSPFFPLDNAVGRGEWSAEKQATFLQQLGFDGISYNYTNAADIARCRAELEKRNLKFFGLYFAVRLGQPEPLPADFLESVRALSGSGCALWVIFPSPITAGNYDEDLVKHLRALSALGQEHGLPVVIYPHAGFYIATAEQALRFVDQLPELPIGMTVNLSHELHAGNGHRLKEIIERAGPKMTMMTINGASDIPGKGWNNFIKPLDEGDYDVQGLLRFARNRGFTGPVGLQAYNVKLPPEENLQRAITTWKRWAAQRP